MNFNITLFNNKRDNKPKAASVTWQELCEQLAHPLVRREKDGPLFSPATFNPQLRRKENVTELSLLVLDCDHGAILDRLVNSFHSLRCAFAIYSTHSHLRITDSNPNAEPRFRVVIPLAEPVPVTHFSALWKWGAGIKGISVDEQAKDASRIFYTPVKASVDAPYQLHIEVGDFLNWHSLNLGPYEHTKQTERCNYEATSFKFHEDRHAELCKRILVRAERNSRGNFDAQCLAHNGKGKTALVYFPDSGAVKCNAGCNYSALLVAEGLPVGYLPSKRQWELPATFYEYNLPDFPSTTLPSWLQVFVKGLARETQTPEDLTAILAITVCSGAVAGKVRVQARQGWVEPSNIYTLTALNPGNRKSAVFNSACEPIEEQERDLTEQKRDEIAQAQSEYRMLEERLTRLEKDAAKIEDSVERQNKKDEAIKVAQELAAMKIPVQPRLICSDVTPERLASLLAEQGGRMCLFSPEGDLFDMLAGRYTGGVPNFDVILKGHSGDTLRVDRRGRSEHVKYPALTIGLTVQPDVIRGLMDKPGFRGRGLLGRFFYILPTSTIGSRLIDPEPLSEEVRQTFKNNIKAMAQLEPASDYEGSPVARMLYLTAEANSLLKQFEAELEPQLGEDGALGMMADWAAKLAGGIVRIAGILHLAEHAQKLAPWPERVAAETMSNAITIGRYLIPHAKAAFAEMGADSQIENAKYLLRWIERAEQSSFTKRDVHQAHKGRFKKVAEIEPALELLEAHGYIRARADITERRPGRKSSQIFDVNPFLFTQSQNSHNPQNYPQQNNSEDSENCEDESSDNFSVSPSFEQPVLAKPTTERERVRI